MTDLVDSMLDLMRRLPPTRTEENVAALIGICPDYADDLLGSVDQPLQLKTDRATGRDYLACDYNRDGESYRWVQAFFCGSLVCGRNVEGSRHELDARRY
jgi:capping protein beta